MAGSGKTTLSKEVSTRLRMPVISRDEIKEGYVNTYGLKHDQLPEDTNAVVSNFFFELPDATTFGTIRAGSRADLVLLESNPLEDISEVENINGVMVAGRWFTAEELRKMKKKASTQ